MSQRETLPVAMTLTELWLYGLTLALTALPVIYQALVADGLI